jgi:phosphoribosylformylglycinamidine synthase
MSKPNCIVLSGYGLNCEEETKFAFDLSGGKADIVHINDLIEKPKTLTQYNILAIPGGFAYGDDTGSGNAYANKLRNHLWPELLQFVKKDTLVIGICNGFQILINLGLLPALESKYGRREVALLHNTNARYTVRWVDITICNNSPWLKGIKKISLPIAHGEGRFYAEEIVLKKLEDKKQIAAKYIKGEICDYQNLHFNPNGSMSDIAAITDESGRILGIMPHPERALFFNQLPHWTYLREKYIRERKKIPMYGCGLHIFKNAVNYFREQ